MGVDGGAVATSSAEARADAGLRRAGSAQGVAPVLVDPPPFLPLRPVGPGAVLDGAVEILRYRLGRFVALAAVLLVPLQALQVGLVLGGVLPGAEGRGTPFALPVLAGADGAVGVVLVVLDRVALALLGIAAGRMVAGWLEGRDPGLGDLLRHLAARSWVAVVLVLVTAAVRVPFLCLSVLGWWLSDAFVFVGATVAGAEHRGPVASLRRSFALTRHAYGFALVVTLGGLALSVLLKVVLWFGPVALVSATVPAGWLVTAVERLGSLTLLVVEPLVACIAARAWLELRCRTEGLDLERWRAAR